MVFSVEGRADDPKVVPIANFCYVTPGFFQTLEIGMKDGRTIEPHDATDGAPIVIVNETFERIYFKHERATGRRLVLNGRSTEIVGVSRDVQHNKFTR